MPRRSFRQPLFLLTGKALWYDLQAMNKKILCLGASNTYGFDPRSYIGSRYPQQVRWTGRLEGWDVINRGINGLTVPRDFPVFADLIRAEEPDLILIMLGTNDLLEGRSAEETCHRMEAFLGSIKSLSRPVLLISPPWLQLGECVQKQELIRESQRLGGLLQELAKRENCLFADAGEWGIGMCFDGMHFSPAGHEAFAQRLGEILASLTVCE